MRDFDTITIQEMSKNDMLLILEALSYTAENTEIDAFLDLRDNILNDLSAMAEMEREEFLKHLSE